jgi:ABC-type multidrug transport system ATPase subunit
VSNIVFEDITKRYGDGFKAVKDMNLNVDDGES